MSAFSINARKGHKGFHTVPLVPRFWAKVEKRGEDECWPWNGPRNTAGYGYLTTGGTGSPRRNKGAHRISWELHYGRPFPQGMHACHSCDNRWCVNPAHIWPGTNSDNMRDASRKGRIPGSHPKLPATKLREIAERRKAGERTVDLAREYGVSGATINRYVAREAATCR